MAQSANTSPKVITDKNGKITTVHAKTSSQPTKRILPRIPTAAGVEVKPGIRRVQDLGDDGQLFVTDAGDRFEIYVDRPETFVRILDGSPNGITAWKTQPDEESTLSQRRLTFENEDARLRFIQMGDAFAQIDELVSDYDKTYNGHVRIPNNYTGEVNVAQDYVDDRLVASAGDPIGAQAEYAEVGEEGISYGIDIPDNYIADAIIAPQSSNESDEDFRTRVVNGINANIPALEKFFEDEYGADVAISGGDSLSVEFYVNYEDGGALMSSLEYMGDRAESETKLIDFYNDFENFSLKQKMQEKIDPA